MATSLEPVTKVSDELKALLNEAIAREIQVSVQYMWQHVQVSGVKAVAVQDKFRSTAIAVGDNLKEFLEFDTKAEVEAVEMYRRIIKLATDEGDITTAFMFKEILEDEEDHHDLFTTMLEEV